MRRHALQVRVTDGQGRRVPSSGLGVWLERHAPASARGGVTVALISDAVMRRLNRTFRGNDKVTDVLSFPLSAQAAGPWPKAVRLKATGPWPKVKRADKLGPWAISLEPALGDIAIAMGRARRQARDYGHPTATELRVLALHGLLHLLGYDHDVDQGEMGRLEERLRRRAGLPGGLIRRADRAPRMARR
jgi:probable rRNA maturation factor